MMSRVQKGMVAGAVATLAISLLEALNILVLKWFAAFPLIVANLVGMPGNMTVGWIVHAIVGVFILGPLFGVLYSRLPTDTAETKGILFAVGAFAAFMVAVMLFGDNGSFGRSFGSVAWILFMHAVFGIVLGNVYARLLARDRRRLTMSMGAAPAH